MRKTGTILKNTVFALVLASVILSSTGMLTSASAQLAPSSITNTVNSVLPTQTVTTTSLPTDNIVIPSLIVLNNVQSTSGTTNVLNQITLGSFDTGTGDNKMLIVGVSADKAGAISVTFGGQPLIQAVSSFHNNDAEVWYLKNPAGTGDITVTTSGTTHAVVGAYSFANVDQVNPIPTTASNFNTSPSSPSITLTTKYPTDWIIDVPSIYGGSTLGSPTCTPRWNDNMPNTITGASSSREAPNLSVATCSWTASSPDLWDDVGIELKAQGASIFDLIGGVIGSNQTGSGGSNSTSSTGITVYAHRIPASYWDPCFATTCDQGTGPGVTMWVDLYDANGNFLKGMFTDEHGNTFTGLNPAQTYYVYPTDCENCHGSPHDVVFQYWGDNHSSERPRAATVGAQLHAWYSCTNNCADGP